MACRGAFGVRVDGKDKLTYNHSGSDLDCLGIHLFRYLQNADLNSIKIKAKNLEFVDSHSEPSQEQIEKLAPYTDLKVEERSTSSWYCLTRDLQGELAKILEVGIMVDCNTFINDGLYCEWAYIVNLDDNKFEIYKGLQRNPHTKGRYASNERYTAYYPCALVAEFPLNALPDVKEFLACSLS